MTDCRAERGEHDLAEGSQVRGRQPGQLGADHGLDGGVTDEGGEPRVRVEPLAVGAQGRLQRREPAEVVEVGDRARLCLRPVVAQAGEQHRVVGWVPGEAPGDVEPERPAAGRRGEHRALHRVEPVVTGQHSSVVQHRRQVGVEQQEPADMRRSRDEPERRPGDDAHLSEPGARCVEQVDVAGRRAGDPFTPPGDERPSRRRCRSATRTARSCRRPHRRPGFRRPTGRGSR